MNPSSEVFYTCLETHESVTLQENDDYTRSKVKNGKMILSSFETCVSYFLYLQLLKYYN